VLRGQLASTKRADIDARRRAAYQHGHPLPFYRHLSANRAAGVLVGQAGTEEACPPREPLIQSFRTVLPVLAANVGAVAEKRPVTSSDRF